MFTTEYGASLVKGQHGCFYLKAVGSCMYRQSALSFWSDKNNNYQATDVAGLSILFWLLVTNLCRWYGIFIEAKY
jgi:hypothetical protein